MKRPRILSLIGLVVASIAAAQPVPPELSALAFKARLDRPVAAWCRGEFRSGRAGAFAAALTSEAGGGRYVVLESDATVVELASFTGGPDVSCYSPNAARRLHSTIGSSSTISGQLTPQWTTTVVCGFVENTHAVCWQYSPARNAYVKVGEWTT